MNGLFKNWDGKMITAAGGIFTTLVALYIIWQITDKKIGDIVHTLEAHNESAMELQKEQMKVLQDMTQAIRDFQIYYRRSSDGIKTLPPGS